MPIHEDEQRRDDWIEGRSVQLENDEQWMFPLPRLEYGLSLDPAVEPVASIPDRESNRKFGRDFWAIKDQVQAFMDEIGPETKHVELARAVLPGAVNMLRRNYTIPADAIPELFRVVVGDERNVAMWLDIARLIVGIGPKPQPAA